MYLAKVSVMLKESVLDPQGQAVTHALHNLNHNEIRDIRIGKYIEIRLEAENRGKAEALVREYCEKLLANSVIENFRFEVEPLS
jgi:phosphoribosylformylglycinamidine synthase